jgi:hypothetical protein
VRIISVPVAPEWSAWSDNGALLVGAAQPLACPILHPNNRNRLARGNLELALRGAAVFRRHPIPGRAETKHHK